jgi:hypothetical protein
MAQPSLTPAADRPQLSREYVHAILRASRFGIHAYPGPVGELIERELRAYVDGGRRLPPDSTAERLLAVLLEALGKERKAPTMSRPGAPTGPIDPAMAIQTMQAPRRAHRAPGVALSMIESMLPHPGRVP